MNNSTDWVNRIKQRANKLQVKKEKRAIRGLFSLCLMLSFGLVAYLGCISSGGSCIVPGAYGSMLMYEDAGSHVLVAVISFIVAVAITVICIRIREKNKKNNNSKKDE